jgi:hypothetical protein
VELPRETATRECCKRKKATLENANNSSSPSQDHPGSSRSQEAPARSKVKLLNLLTYKFHALGDYVQTIKLFGTTDSYSTQVVSENPFVHRGSISYKVFA